MRLRNSELDFPALDEPLEEWQADKNWSDRFVPEIKPILGLHLIGAAPYEEDCQRNTDLIVLRMEAIRIACRIRHYEYFDKYGDEVTIRRDRPNGGKTEFTKIIEGWGNYFFYGFSDKEERHLHSWKLCDLNAFRIWFNRYLRDHRGQEPGWHKSNRDGSSSFRAFVAKDIPEFIVAEGGFDGVLF